VPLGPEALTGSLKALGVRHYQRNDPLNTVIPVWRPIPSLAARLAGELITASR
jgi:uncharacterized membrane protein